MTAPRVVVAGGHSAGHIEPTMIVADVLRPLEPTTELTAARGYPLEPIPPARTPNRAPLQAPGRLRDSVRAAEAHHDRVRAEVVVGSAAGSRHHDRDPAAAGSSQGARAINTAVSARPRRCGRPACGCCTLHGRSQPGRGRAAIPLIVNRQCAAGRRVVALWHRAPRRPGA